MSLGSSLRWLIHVRYFIGNFAYGPYADKNFVITYYEDGGNALEYKNIFEFYFKTYEEALFYYNQLSSVGFDGMVH